MPKIIMPYAYMDEAMKILTANAQVTVLNTEDRDEIKKNIKNADALVMKYVKIDRSFIKENPDLIFISKMGVGVDGIDVEAATEAGVAVVNTPGANADSVAEFAIMSILAAAKKIFDCDAEVKKGNYVKFRANYNGSDLLGKNLVIAGFGNIGRKIALVCSALGMNIYIFDKFVQRQTVESFGYKYGETIEELLPLADFLTIHIPLTDETRNFIARKQFDLMKSSAILINDARGGIVDEHELANRLNSGRIAGAACDVFSREPVESDNVLLTAKNIILSPHIAGATPDAINSMAMSSARGAASLLNGEEWGSVVNPQVYKMEKWKKWSQSRKKSERK